MPIGVYPRKITPAVDRVLRKIKVHPLGCWEFTGGLHVGYGRVRHDNGRNVTAHRVVYEAEVGSIPAGWHVDHMCFNPRCVNPAHLEAVTGSENTLRSWRAGRMRAGITNTLKTHCKHGHEYSVENTYVNAQGHRSCRTCGREAMRKRRARK